MIRLPPRSTLDRSSAASDVYKRQEWQEETPSASGRVVGSELQVAYWLRAAPGVARARIHRAGAAPRDLLILLLTQAYAERCWPLGDRGFLLGPHLVNEFQVDAAGALSVQVDARGVEPWYWVDADGRLLEIKPPTAQALQAAAPALQAWERLPVAELEANVGWQALDDLQRDRPNAHGYAWYRARFTAQQPPGLTTLAAPGLADRGHLFVDGAFIGALGVGPQGPTLAAPWTLTLGEHDLRVLVDDLGRFNYGSGLGEIKGLTDTFYLGGEQTDITTGWTALWQEAAFAGEALANACLLYTSPSPRDRTRSRMPSSACKKTNTKKKKKEILAMCL